MQQVLRSTETQVVVTFYMNEVATDEDANTVTVDVYRDNGDTVATGESTANTAVGEYTYSLAPQSDLDQLRLVFTGTFSGVQQSITRYVEVVGDHLFSISELRAQPNLDSAAKFPMEELIQARTETTDIFERYCDTAFRPRYGRHEFAGDGSRCAFIDRHRPLRSIIGAKVDGVAQTTTAWTVEEWGMVEADEAVFAVATPKLNCEITYEYGHDQVPSDIQRAGLTYARALMLAKYQEAALPDRGVSLTNEFGVVRLALPGPNAPTGYPQVDAVLNLYKLDRVIVR